MNATALSALPCLKKLKSRNEPAGILKWEPRCQFMVRAWRVMRLLKVPIEALKKMPVDHNGMILIRVLRASTSSMVQSLHDLL
jgi:hypothetical protein